MHVLVGGRVVFVNTQPVKTNATTMANASKVSVSVMLVFTAVTVVNVTSKTVCVI